MFASLCLCAERGWLLRAGLPCASGTALAAKLLLNFKGLNSSWDVLLALASRGMADTEILLIIKWLNLRLCCSEVDSSPCSMKNTGKPNQPPEGNQMMVHNAQCKRGEKEVLETNSQSSRFQNGFSSYMNILQSLEYFVFWWGWLWMGFHSWNVSLQKPLLWVLIAA